MKHLIIILAGIGLLAAYSVNRLIEKYTIKVKKVKMNWPATLQSAGNFIVINVLFNFINPTTTRLQINRLTFYVFYKDHFITSVVKNELIDINPKAITEIPANVIIDVKNTVSQVKPALIELLNNQSIELTLKGYLQTGLIKIPFNTLYKVEL